MSLDAEQYRLAALVPEPWHLGAEDLLVGGCFVAFARGEQGPGHAGDRGWAGASLVRCPGLVLVDVRLRYGCPALQLRRG